ncbi:MAG: hypothetical protein BWY02_02925 [bacterium ADurb.Bin157]|nr:MAG: hypothetical protein BWY02_02925 [bacterium ADurb.Bin157]
MTSFINLRVLVSSFPLPGFCVIFVRTVECSARYELKLSIMFLRVSSASALSLFLWFCLKTSMFVIAVNPIPKSGTNEETRKMLMISFFRLNELSFAAKISKKVPENNRIPVSSLDICQRFSIG